MLDDGLILKKQKKVIITIVCIFIITFFYLTVKPIWKKNQIDVNFKENPYTRRTFILSHWDFNTLYSLWRSNPFNSGVVWVKALERNQTRAPVIS